VCVVARGFFVLWVDTLVGRGALVGTSGLEVGMCGKFICQYSGLDCCAMGAYWDYMDAEIVRCCGVSRFMWLVGAACGWPGGSGAC